MGYRSQVALALKKETYHKHEKTLAPHLKDCDNIHQTEGAYYFYWNDVKWYESYEDVKTITKVIDNLDWEEYAFIRVGDDDDDVLYEGDHINFEIYVSRSIDIPTTKDSKIPHKDFFAPQSVKFIKEDA